MFKIDNIVNIEEEAQGVIERMYALKCLPLKEYERITIDGPLEGSCHLAVWDIPRSRSKNGCPRRTFDLSCREVGQRVLAILGLE